MQTICNFTMSSLQFLNDFCGFYSFSQKQSVSNPIRMALPQLVLAPQPIPGGESLDDPRQCIRKMRNKKFSKRQTYHVSCLHISSKTLAQDHCAGFTSFLTLDISEFCLKPWLLVFLLILFHCLSLLGLINILLE